MQCESAVEGGEEAVCDACQVRVRDFFVAAVGFDVLAHGEGVGVLGGDGKGAGFHHSTIHAAGCGGAQLFRSTL